MRRPTTTLAASALAVVGLLAACSPADSDGSDAAPTEPETAEPTTAEAQRVDATAPEINAPTVPNCPYHEEVSELEGTQAQVDLAIELGCEPGPHGEIDFEEPLLAENGDEIYGLISTDHAMSVGEMCEAGYISDEDCEAELNR